MLLHPPAHPSPTRPLCAAAEAAAQPPQLPQLDPAALLEQLSGRDAVLPEVLLEVRHAQLHWKESRMEAGGRESAMRQLSCATASCALSVHVSFACWPAASPAAQQWGLRVH